MKEEEKTHLWAQTTCLTSFGPILILPVVLTALIVDATYKYKKTSINIK